MGLILQVWHLRQLQRWEGCSSLAARMGVGSRVWCYGCAAGMHVDASGEFQLRGRSRPRCAAWVFGRAAAAVLRCEGAGGGLRPEFCASPLISPRTARPLNRRPPAWFNRGPFSALMARKALSLLIIKKITPQKHPVSHGNRFLWKRYPSTLSTRMIQFRPRLCPSLHVRYLRCVHLPGR